ncbi:MAG TPA: FG-GAP-like repeat-containing protein, partial [Rudaea sp.]
LDFAVALSGIYVSGGYQVFLGDGAGHFSALGAVITSGSGGLGIVAGHFTGHAPLDLAYADSNQGNVVILRGAGNGTFSVAQTIPTKLSGTSAYPFDLVASDVDSDGRMDLLVADFAPRGSGGEPSQPGNDVAVLRQNAAGSFDAPVHVAAGTDVISVAAGDFNADGHPDFVTANAAWGFSGTVRFGDGTTNFGAGPTTYPAGGNPYNVATGDLNNDGSTDFIVVNQPSNTLSVYLDNCLPGNHAPVANADSGFGFVTDKSTAFNTASVLANDTDADHDALAVTQIDTNGTLGTVTSNGDGTLHYDPTGKFPQLGPTQQTTDTFRYTITDGHGTYATTTVTITVLGAQPADLQIAAPTLPAPLVAGAAPFQIAISATNLSANTANTVIITATLSNLEVVDPGTCSVTGSSTLICLVGNLSGGGIATVTPKLRVLSNTTGNAQINVGVSGNETDPVAENNTAFVRVPIVLSADAHIAISDNADTVAAGDSPTYTIIVGNDGPSDIGQASVLLTPPAEFLNLTWTCATNGLGACSASGSAAINDAVALPSGAQLTYTVHGMLSPSFAGPIFSLSAGVVSAVGDPASGNEIATDSDSVAYIGDVSVSVDLASSFAVINRLSRYTVVVANSGPSQIGGVQIGSAAPTGLTAVTWSCVVAGGASCGGSGNGALADTVTLPPGSSVRYTVTGIVTTQSDFLDVNASLTPPPGVVDPQSANNAVSVAVPVSLFRSGFESDELAPPPGGAIAATGSGGEMMVAPPGSEPTLLAQWNCDGSPCAYLIGVQRAHGVSATIVQRTGDAQWQASAWQPLAPDAPVSWTAHDGSPVIALGNTAR